jgi:hypothetical protein
MVCILGYPCRYDSLTKKWPKMTTAVHLSANNSKTKVVSSLKKAYPSEGVSTLNVAGKIEFLMPLCSTLQFDKVWEAKKLPVLALFTACSLTEDSTSLSVPIQWLWPCDPFVTVALSWLDVERSYCFVLSNTWFALAEDGKKTRANLFGHNSGSTVPA